MNSQGNHPPVLDRTSPRIGQSTRESVLDSDESPARATGGLEESLDNIEMNFKGVRDSVIDKTKEYSRTANSFVKKNPWAAMGISAGFALLVGMLIGRKRGD